MTGVSGWAEVIVVAAVVVVVVMVEAIVVVVVDELVLIGMTLFPLSVDSPLQGR